MERREFSRLLRDADLSPNEYAQVTGFDRRNVKRWVFDDNAIPEKIRQSVLNTLRLDYTETLEGLSGPDPYSRRHNVLFRLRHKLKTITHPMRKRNGAVHFPRPFLEDTLFNQSEVFRDMTHFIKEGKYSAPLVQRPAD
jgi:hypothetical protein